MVQDEYDLDSVDDCVEVKGEAERLSTAGAPQGAEEAGLDQVVVQICAAAAPLFSPDMAGQTVAHQVRGPRLRTTRRQLPTVRLPPWPSFDENAVQLADAVSQMPADASDQHQAGASAEVPRKDPGGQKRRK